MNNFGEGKKNRWPRAEGLNQQLKAEDQEKYIPKVNAKN